MAEDLLATIRTFIEKASRKPAPDLSDGTRLEDLPVDSLDLYTLIGELEDETGKSMPDADFQKLDTVGDLASYFRG